MKQVIDFLRKIGLLHVSSGDFQSSEFDDRKDLKEKKDESGDAVVGASALDVEASASSVGHQAMQSAAKGTMLFRVIMAVAAIVLVLFLLVAGFTFWFFVSLIMWGWLVFWVHKAMIAGTFVIKKTVILLGVFFVLTFIFMGMGGSVSQDSSQSSDDASSAGDDWFYEVSQANFGVSLLAVDPSGENKKMEHVLMTINPLITLNTGSLYDSDAVLEEFEIRDLKVKGFKKGDVKRIAPKHVDVSDKCTGLYLEGCKNSLAAKDVGDDGDEIVYNVVEGEPKFYDEVSEDSPILPDFRIVVMDVGDFDHEEVMKRDGRVDGSRVAQYAGLTADDLSGTVELDLYFKMNNGDKKTYHISADIAGEKVLRGGTVVGNVK